MDPTLTGRWRVVGTDMVVGRTVHLIAGLPGQRVEFTPDGRYRVGVSEYCCRTFRRNGLTSLDVWMEGTPSCVTRCIFRVDDDRLSICIAGDLGSRPKEFRRDDELLWCLTTMERAGQPKRRSTATRRSSRATAAGPTIARPQSRRAPRKPVRP